MPPVSGVVKDAEDILERIFTPRPKASPAEQAERVLRRPRRVVYCAISNRNFYWRQHISKFVLDEGAVPIVPFMLFDYYLLHTVPKETVREAFNNLIVKCDEMWVFGSTSLGVKVQIGIAKRFHKQVRYYDITTSPIGWSPSLRRWFATNDSWRGSVRAPASAGRHRAR